MQVRYKVVDRRTDGQKDERTNKYMYRQTDTSSKFEDKYTDKQAGRPKDEVTDRKIKQTDRHLKQKSMFCIP